MRVTDRDNHTQGPAQTAKRARYESGIACGVTSDF